MCIPNCASWDSGAVHLSWEPDADFLAVSWLSSQVCRSSDSCQQIQLEVDGQHRQVRVFSARSGGLFSTGQTVANLEEGLSWRPMSHCIAASQRSQHGLQIVFFERNGLMHGEFSLAGNPEAADWRVARLEYNCDGSLLAVQLAGIKATSSLIRIFSMSNYHWYAKFDCRFSLDGTCVDWMWTDCSESKQLAALFANCDDAEDPCKLIQWIWTAESCLLTESQSNYLGMSFIVDGRNLHMTDFGKAIIPPPFRDVDLQFSESILHCKVHGSESSPNRMDLLVQLVDLKICCVTWIHDLDHRSHAMQFPLEDSGSVNCVVQQTSNERLPRLVPNHVRMLNVAKCLGVILDSQWLEDSNLLVLNEKRTKIYLICLEIEDSKSEIQPIEIFASENSLIESFRIVENRSSLEFSCMLLVLIEKGTLIVGRLNGESSQSSIKSLNYSQMCEVDCSHIFPNHLNDPLIAWKVNDDCSKLIIGSLLSTKRRLSLIEISLSANNQQEITNCSSDFSNQVACLSILLTRRFLFITSLDQRLVIIYLENFKDLQEISGFVLAHCGSQSACKLSNCWVRNVEQGSELHAMNQEAGLVLRLPRGNLEVVHPKALVLLEVSAALDRVDFLAALTTARRHRLDLNILHDHNPQHFLHHVDDFVEQVDDAELLCLFVVSLMPGNCRKSTFHTFYANQPITDSCKSINQICSKLKESMMRADRDKFKLAIISCFLMCDPKQVDEAFVFSKQYLDLENQSAWQQCLKHMQKVYDEQSLYRLALGTYDMNLALSVAEQSNQSDPREFISHLESFRKILDESMRRYRIDRELKRPERALTNLIACIDSTNSEELWDELLELIRQHDLFRPAARRFAASVDKLQMIGKEWSSALIGRKRLQDAALVCQSTGLHSQAASLFHKLNNWPAWLISARLAGCSEQEIAQQAESLADKLWNVSRFTEAIEVYTHVLKDPLRGVNLALDQHLWTMADSLQSVHGLPSNWSSYEADKRKRMLQLLQHVDKQCTEAILQIVKQRSRVVQVRLQQRNSWLDRRMESGATLDCGDDASDWTADSDSVVSVSSRGSDRTADSRQSSSKSTKRSMVKRVKWTLREGSSLEEVALMESLHSSIIHWQQLIKQIREPIRLVSILDLEEKDDFCQQLEDKIRDLLKEQKETVLVVWDDFLLDSSLDVNMMMNQEDKYLGRRRYPQVREVFLRFQPEIKPLESLLT